MIRPEESFLSIRIDQLREKGAITGARLKDGEEVVINNQISDRFTVIEVAGLERSGLLYDLTSALSDLGLDINSAHIATYGERAVDVFYVTTLEGGRVEEEDRAGRIKRRLTAVLAAGPA